MPNVTRKAGALAAAATVACALTFTLAGAVAGARAQPPDETAEDPASSRAAAFRAVEGPEQESVPGGPLLLGAYAVVWLLVLGLVARIAQMQRHNAKELARIEGLVRRATETRPRAE